MRRLMTVAITVTACLAAVGALAQGGAGAGSGASAGAGHGPGSMRGGPGAGWGSDFTPGWTMMTQQERNEHRDRMRAMKTYEECQAYQQQHHEQMAARAKERGANPPAQPRRDACAGLKR